MQEPIADNYYILTLKSIRGEWTYGILWCPLYALIVMKSLSVLPTVRLGRGTLNLGLSFALTLKAPKGMSQLNGKCSVSIVIAVDVFRPTFKYQGTLDGLSMLLRLV